MPEKVHTKLDGQDGPVEKNALKDDSKDKTPLQSNGVKRSRDGSPKSTPQGRGQVSNNSGKANGYSYKEDVESERPSKAKKPNGVGVKEKHKHQTKTSSTDRDRPDRAHSNGRAPLPENIASLRANAKKLQKIREQLPIWKAKNDIRHALLHHNVLLLRGETGSGKTTQTPQFLYNQSWCTRKKVKVMGKDGNEEEAWVGGMLAITQPRRVAALTLARRVAAEMGSSYERGVFAEVGHAVRFDAFEPQGMKIKFVTEGTLLMELMTDPHLKKYSCVIIDEIHERSIDVDLVAGFLRRIVQGNLKGRGGIPLKVVIMSATFDLGGYEHFFAQPDTVPNYTPGNDYGRIVDDELLDFFVDDDADSKGSRRSSISYSSWSGFSGDDQQNVDDTKNSTQLATSNSDIEKAGLLADLSAVKQKSKSSIRRKPDSEYIERPETDEDLLRTTAKNGVAVAKVEGRTFPVQVSWQKEASSDYLQKMVQVIMDIHIKQPMPGDILCFLTGQEDIETLQTQIESYANKILAPYPMMRVVPLYGSLPMEQQQFAFDPIKQTTRGIRKVVLATNIAETSVTVPGVRYVVDCGKNKRKMYRPKLDMDSLLPVPISKVSAIQRMGRAGREAPGLCYRIYTEKAHEEFNDDELPEILRCDALDTVLKMKARGVEDVFTFPLMDRPEPDALSKSLQRLTKMGALNSEGKLTSRGKTIAAFPLPAVFGHVMMTAAQSGNDVLLEAVDVISCLTSDSELYLQPKSEEDQEKIEEHRKDIIRREGDIITMLTTVQRYHAEETDRKEWCRKRLISLRAIASASKIRKQLWKQCLKLKLLDQQPPPDPQPFESITPERAETLVKVFLRCFSTKTAILHGDKSYRTIEGRNVITIHPSSVLHGKKTEGILFLENVYTTKNYAKKVSAIQLNWLAELAAER